MAFPPRWLDPDLIHFITSRTLDRSLLLRPSDEANEVIGAALAVAQERHGVLIFDFVVMSNHVHLALQSREGRIPDFMRDFKSQVAVGINRILGREGHLWARRYKAAAILDEEAQLARARYIYGHGVKEGLVARAEQWPGEASIKERLTGRRPVYTAFDRTAWFWEQRKSSEPVDERDFQREVQVVLTDWPFLADLGSDDARRARVAQLAEEERVKAAEKRGGAPALGVERVLAQSPSDRPLAEPKRTPNPLCHASTRELRRAYRELWLEFVAAFHAASELFRAGLYDTAFPAHAFRPPLPRTWRPISGLPPLPAPA